MADVEMEQRPGYAVGVRWAERSRGDCRVGKVWAGPPPAQGHLGSILTGGRWGCGGPVWACPSAYSVLSRAAEAGETLKRDTLAGPAAEAQAVGDPGADGSGRAPDDCPGQPNSASAPVASVRICRVDTAAGA